MNNVNFMYLLEEHRPPDHNTIARFRKEHLPYAVEDLLNQMVKLLEVSATGIAAPHIITVQRLKNLRKCLYAKKTETNTTFVKGKGHHKSGLQKAIETINVHPVWRVVVDSGYESEENYKFVDGSEQLSLFLKPSDHAQKKKRKYKNDIGCRENMAYNAEKDEYTCAQGKNCRQ